MWYCSLQFQQTCGLKFTFLTYFKSSFFLYWNPSNLKQKILVWKHVPLQILSYTVFSACAVAYNREHYNFIQFFKIQLCQDEEHLWPRTYLVLLHFRFINCKIRTFIITSQFLFLRNWMFFKMFYCFLYWWNTYCHFVLHIVFVHSKQRIETFYSCVLDMKTCRFTME